MKYEVKRSRIEEIVIDLEDGCVIKVTDKNIRSLNCTRYCDNSRDVYWDCVVELINGVTVVFPTRDRDLLNDLRQLCNHSVFR